MKIPKIISKKGQEYIFVKEYPEFYLYENMITKTKQCFKRDELIEIQQKRKPLESKWEREKVGYGF